MAVFKAPRINSLQRSTLLLEASEIVYDTDLNSFFGGNGIDFGGFPIGQGAAGTSVSFNYTLSQEDVESGFIELEIEPSSPDSVRLTVAGGIEQVNGIDFQVIGSILSWDGLGLDNFLESGDILIIYY